MHRILRSSIAFLVAVALLGCEQQQHEQLTTRPSAVTHSTQTEGSTIEQLAERGGRVDWHKGDAHALIAYDAISDARRKNTEVYTIEPDGSQQRCVTCDTPLL